MEGSSNTSVGDRKRQPVSPTELSQDISMVSRNAHRLLRLVNQLLDISKLEAGEMKLRARELDIAELVRQIASSFESQAVRKGIRFTIGTPRETLFGWFDRDAIEKVLTNLLSNALKFTPEGGTVEVLLSTVGRDARLAPRYRSELSSAERD